MAEERQPVGYLGWQICTGGYELVDAFYTEPQRVGTTFTTRRIKSQVIRPKNAAAEQEIRRFDPYEPSTYPEGKSIGDLFSELANASRNIDKLMRFIDNFGLLTSEPYNFESSNEGKGALEFEGDRLEEIFSEIDYFEISNMLIYALSFVHDDEKINYLNKNYKIEPVSPRQLRFCYLKRKEKWFFATGSKDLFGYSSHAKIDYSYQFLYNTLNSALLRHRAVTQTIGERSNVKGKLSRHTYIVPDNLLGAIWHLRSDSVRKSSRQRQCVRCQSWFVAKRSHALFCGRACIQANYRDNKAIHKLS